jgi:hypothetical protein
MIIQQTIKQSILNMIDVLKTIEDSDQAREKNAELLAKIIVDAILSADIPIIPVQVIPISGTGTTTSTAKLI